MKNIDHQQAVVKDYYEKVIKSTKDLKTNACCSVDNLPQYIKDILRNIDAEILEKFYGCGSPIPLVLGGAHVLDLGCGTGRDVYVLSALVGNNGKVIGIDMSNEQLAIARKHLDSQAQRFGLHKPNIEFKQGYIEDLRALNISDNSQDVIVSNCVINLSPDKKSVFREIFRVLKEGGELYFSDVFADRRIPESLTKDSVLLGECLAGAMYIEDFRRLMRILGCLDYRIVNQRKIAIANTVIEEKIGMVNFYSMTIRAFKIPQMEDLCEDYGQVATYLGTISQSPHNYGLDSHHLFETKKPLRICSNTAFILQKSRLAPHFTVSGDLSNHFGPFAGCGQDLNADLDRTSGSCC